MIWLVMAASGAAGLKPQPDFQEAVTPCAVSMLTYCLAVRRP
jgi:hypothetical protein